MASNASPRSAVVSAPVAEPVTQPASVPLSTPKPAALPKAEGKAEAKTEVRSEDKASSDAQKAKALLEGRSATAEATKLVVQVGAFSDADKVREVRRKLEQAGLKTYTQSVEGKDGKRTTRVRVGPFETRAEADKAAARIRKLDLQANVISL